MDNFIRARIADPRYRVQRFADEVYERPAEPWYAAGMNVERYNASMSEEGGKKKREKKEGASSSSSGSESEGGTKKKKKKKGRCWEGYEPTPGKEPYSDGSCRKK